MQSADTLCCHAFTMRLRRFPRHIVAILALFSILFMQSAVASYVCPGDGQLLASSVVSVTMDETMGDCAGMDMEQPSLCHAYSENADHSLDKPGTHAIWPFTPAALVTNLCVLDPDDLSDLMYGKRPILARATAPPITIRHCCFRI